MVENAPRMAAIILLDSSFHKLWEHPFFNPIFQLLVASPSNNVTDNCIVNSLSFLQLAESLFLPGSMATLLIINSFGHAVIEPLTEASAPKEGYTYLMGANGLPAGRVTTFERPLETMVCSSASNAASHFPVLLYKY